MSATRTAVLTANLNALITAAIATGGTVAAPITLPVSTIVNLANGTAANQCDCIYAGTATLSASGTTDIDMHSLTDVLGNALAMVRAKLVIIYNTATLEADGCTVGNKTTTAGWTSFINPNTGAIFCPGAGGFIIMAAPGATGFVIGASSTNHLLTLTSTASSNPITVGVIVCGCSA